MVVGFEHAPFCVASCTSRFVFYDGSQRTARPSAPRPGISTADVTTDTVVTTGVMSSPNSTSPSSSGVETGASVGLVGAVLFLVVIIIIIIIRNRKGKCQHDPETTTGDDGVSMVSEDVDITRPKTNVTEMVSSIYRDTDYKTRYRKSSCISDPDMRALVEEMLIDPKRLTLGGIIGKGRPICLAGIRMFAVCLLGLLRFIPRTYTCL